MVNVAAACIYEGAAVFMNGENKRLIDLPKYQAKMHLLPSF
jgi:hypothetical protein